MKKQQAKTPTSAKLEIKALPPIAFTNALNNIKAPFDINTYRTSPEWKMFVAGYNAAVRDANDSIKAKYNLGHIAERVFQN